MSAQEETLDVEPCKFEEPLLGNANGNLEPSLNKEGVETRHKEPKSKDMVKEQSRPQTEMVVKTIVVRKSSDHCDRAGSNPAPDT